MRLGLVIPSVNVVIEDDMRRFLPPGISAHVTRIALTGTSAAALKQALSAAPAAARLLVHAGVGAVALACTGASVASDDEGGAAPVLEAATGLPALDTLGALVAAFRALAATRLSLFSPFDDAFNAVEASALEAAGFQVVRSVGLNIRDPRECAEIDPGRLVDLAAEADHPSADALFLSCANLRGFEAVHALETRIGKPVVTSNQAVLWALLRLVGSTAAVPRGGRLFALGGIRE